MSLKDLEKSFARLERAIRKLQNKYQALALKYQSLKEDHDQLLTRYHKEAQTRQDLLNQYKILQLREATGGNPEYAELLDKQLGKIQEEISRCIKQMKQEG